MAFEDKFEWGPPRPTEVRHTYKGVKKKKDNWLPFAVIFVIALSSFVIAGVSWLENGKPDFLKSEQEKKLDKLIFAYEHTKGEGAWESYFRASVIAEMYLEMEDVENYKKWKKISNGWQDKFGNDFAAEYKNSMREVRKIMKEEMDKMDELFK